MKKEKVFTGEISLKIFKRFLKFPKNLCNKRDFFINIQNKNHAKIKPKIGYKLIKERKTQT